MGLACEMAGATVVAAKLSDASPATMIERVLVLSISCASWAKLVCKTILAPDSAAGKAP